MDNYTKTKDYEDEDYEDFLISKNDENIKLKEEHEALKRLANIKQYNTLNSLNFSTASILNEKNIYNKDFNQSKFSLLILHYNR